jgi:CRP/FNR family transcriptional regulator, cyclic AMP receptor protein
MTDLDSTESQLARVPLFHDLSKQELGRISTLMTTLTEPAGKVLTTEGEVGREFIIVLDGEVEVRHGDHVIATKGAGEFFGEIALLCNRPRTATVVAKTPVTIEVLHRGEFGSLLAQVPELSAQIMATIAQRLAELEGEE